MKKSQQFSAESMMPACFTSPRTALHMLSLSSGVKRSGMYPELSRSFRYTRKSSFTICPSVIRKVTGTPLSPALVYSVIRSSLKSATP